ncbi:MAG: hypothetical protein JO087_12895, partial [Actinobacteria bacterium]|nr:hypothetical protein [Actinomycetota bacterium]
MRKKRAGGLVGVPLGVVAFVVLSHFFVAVDDGVQLIAALLACGACARAARLGSGRAWTWLAASTGAWAAGQAVWMYYEVALQRTAPWPSLADVGYLASVPLTLVGLLSFPAAGRLASGRIRLVLDGLITAGALLGGAWPTLIEPVADQVHVGGHLVLALAYPVLDLVLVVVAVTVAARSAPRQRRAAALVVAGIVAVGFADAAFGVLVATGHYGTGAFLDVGWVVGFLLVAAGALTAAAR